MTVASEITRLYGVRSDIFSAITAKGVTVPSGSDLADCPTLIGQISGGAEPEPPATVLPAYTLRLKYKDGYAPKTQSGSFTQVQGYPNYWDWTNNNTDWYASFSGEAALEKVVAAGDTSGVINMYQLFAECSSLVSVCLFDTSGVTDMSMMFSACRVLKSIPLFNTSSVTNMYGMFLGCKYLSSVPLLDTSSVENMAVMFADCTSMSTVPLLDTSNVTNMSEMFRSTSLTSVPLLNTSKVENAMMVFAYCANLSSVPLFDLSSAVAVDSMFNGCLSLRQIPNFDFTSVTSMSNFARECWNLEEVPALVNTGNVEYCGGAFAYDQNVTSGAHSLYQQLSSNAQISDYSDCFYECGRDTVTGAAELAQIPSSWGGTAT